MVEIAVMEFRKGRCMLEFEWRFLCKSTGAECKNRREHDEDARFVHFDLQV